MNILYLTQEYPPETGWGGVGVYTATIAHAAARLGHSVHILSSAVPPRSSYDYQDEGVQVHRVRRWKFEVPLARRLWSNFSPRTKHQWEYIYGIRGEIARLVQTFAIDIIEGTEIWAEGLLYSYKRSIPIAVKLNGPLFLIRDLNGWPLTLDWRLVDYTDRLWTLRADALTASSASLAALVSAKYAIPRERIKVIPNPVDTERFFPNEDQRTLETTILYTGRLETRKGVMTLVEAIPDVLEAFPNVRFLFVGTEVDSLEARMLRMLRAAGVADHAEFIGHLAHDRISSCYQQSTVCVFPSRYEPFGITCLEAMACGRPVVASNSGGMAEIVQDGLNGLLVPPDDPPALAGAIKQLLQNPERARILGMNARRRMQECYSGEVVARQTLAVYEKTVESWTARGKLR